MFRFSRRPIIGFFIFCVALFLLLGCITFEPFYDDVKTASAYDSVEKLNTESSIQVLNSGMNSTRVDLNTYYNLYTITNEHYIPNFNYFWLNPLHADNSTNDNPGGTCTTVAMQMLLGYHNYYSDRRLIPEFGEDGQRFLSVNFGDINDHPLIRNKEESNLGLGSIGTEDGVFYEIFDNTWISDMYGGQAVGLVKDGAIRFVRKYAPSIQKNVSIVSGLFSDSEAKAEIDAGRPIILGFFPIGTGANGFHVVPAYGYATLNGVEGYIVHYGWGVDDRYIWVPSSWFGFKIKMQVDHEHNLIDSGINVKDTHRKLICSTCGYETVENLYTLNSAHDTITYINFPVEGEISIPGSVTAIIKPNVTETYNLRAIGNNVFANTAISYFYLPSGITSIGDSAFEGCANLTYVQIPSTVTEIGDSAFEYCRSLKSISIPSSVKNIGNYAFFYCDSLVNATLGYNSQLETIGNNAFQWCTKLSNFSIPDGVTSIGSKAFSLCNNISSITIHL